VDAYSHTNIHISRAINGWLDHRRMNQMSDKHTKEKAII
jgi:hypothetical protein